MMWRLWRDTRVAGRTVYRLLGDGEVPMLVPDEVRKCVVFVYYDDPNGVRRPAGTAFFVAVERTHGIEGDWLYLVTAKHVLNGIRARRDDGQMLLRVNRKDGGIAYLECSVDVWTTHPDETLTDDVAVMPWPSVEGVDFLSFPLAGSVDEHTGHGVGDEVFLPGLFVNHAGTERNIPIVRVGNIAAMPAEPVSSKIGPLDAYLIEARSIGGLSGSPVFVNLGLHRMIDGELMQAGAGHAGVYHLLGMMHGHYQVQAPPTGDEAAMDALNDEAINMGIAIVVPVDRIVATINNPSQRDMREKYDREEAEKALPTMDAAEGESEFDRFEDLARRVVQTPKPDAEQQS